MPTENDAPVSFALSDEQRAALADVFLKKGGTVPTPLDAAPETPTETPTPAAPEQTPNAAPQTTAENAQNADGEGEKAEAKDHGADTSPATPDDDADPDDADETDETDEQPKSGPLKRARADAAKYRTRAKAAEAELADVRAELAKTRLAVEHGLTADDAALLVGTPEQMAAIAARIASRPVATPETTTVPVGVRIPATDNAGNVDISAWAAQALGL